MRKLFPRRETAHDQRVVGLNLAIEGSVVKDQAVAFHIQPNRFLISLHIKLRSMGSI